MRDFLMHALATITRHARYHPEDAELDHKLHWSSKVWVSNIFRAYEYLFGRGYGIRAEAESGCIEVGDKLYFTFKPISFEAHVVYLEVLLRNLLRELFNPFKYLQVAPQAVNITVGFLGQSLTFETQTLFLPVLVGAIAFDATSVAAAAATVSPLTWTHTATGSNRIVIIGVAVHIAGGTVNPTITAPTYNAVSSTLIGAQRNFIALADAIALYYLLSPDTGASDTISIAFSGGTTPRSARGGAVSWSGSMQSGQPDAVAGNTGTTANPSLTVTTVADNCWVVGFVGSSVTTVTAGLTNRQNFTNNSGLSRAELQDTNGPKTPAGGQTVNWTIAASSWGAQAASFAPALTTKQTLLGNSRITAKTTQTLLGKGDIKATTLQTLLGKARITIKTTQTLLGKARVTIVTVQTLLGKARVTATTLQTLLGKGDIRRTTTQTLLGKGDILKTTIQTLLGKARIGLITTQTLLGKSRVTIQTLQTIQGKARVTATTLQTLLGKGDILKSTTQTLLGKGRITLITTQTLLGKARLTIQTLQTLLGKSRITAQTLKTLTGKADILATTTQTLLGKARVTITTTQTLLGKSRITIQSLQALLGLARITARSTQVLLGRADIRNTTLRTISGLSNLIITSTQTIQGKSRITGKTVKTIQGKARIAGTALTPALVIVDGQIYIKVGNNIYMGNQLLILISSGKFLLGFNGSLALRLSGFLYARL